MKITLKIFARNIDGCDGEKNTQLSAVGCVCDIEFAYFSWHEVDAVSLGWSLWLKKTHTQLIKRLWDDSLSTFLELSNSLQNWLKTLHFQQSKENKYVIFTKQSVIIILSVAWHFFCLIWIFKCESLFLPTINRFVTLDHNETK